MNQLQHKIEQEAENLGFFNIGFAPVHRLDQEARELEKWLNSGHHGKMTYMENHFEKRIDPSKLVDGAKTIISVAYNYYTDQKFESEDLKFSQYAYGRDYHKVVKKKLQKLLAFIEDEVGAIDARCFVDSAPVMDKVWAEKSGLGWIGKNMYTMS